MRFYHYTYLSHIASLSTVSDDVANYVKHRTFNTNS